MKGDINGDKEIMGPRMTTFVAPFV